MQTLNALMSATLAIAVTGLIGGCLPPEEPKDPEEVAQVVGTTIAEAGGAMASISAGFNTTGEGLGADGMSELGGDQQPDPTEEETKGNVENDVTGSMVTNPECVSLVWAGLSATITFDNCVFSATGLPVNGSLSLAVSLIPARLSLTFDNLTIGDDTFYGTVGIFIAGTEPDLVLGIDADMSYSGASTTLVVDDLLVTGSTAGVNISGNGSVVSPAVNATISAGDVNFSAGDCLPSRGSVSFADGNASGIITFLPTTPSTGDVRLEIPPFAPTTVAMFPPCS